MSFSLAKNAIIIFCSIILSSTLPAIALSENGATEQVSRITGVSPSRIQKIIEKQRIHSEAATAMRQKKYDSAIGLLRTINITNGFTEDDQRGIRFVICSYMKTAGRYEEAYKEYQRLIAEQPLLKGSIAEEEYIELTALLNYQRTGDKKHLLYHVAQLKEKKEAFFPPKGFNKHKLAEATRFLEMAGEIDQALKLVDQYYAAYFPKNLKREPSALGKRNQEGIRLLKEALLRDKREGKNIYAQELINTTEYFGFV